MAKYYRSLFLPNMYGHSAGWTKNIRRLAEGADETFLMGNFINTNLELNDRKQVRRANSKILRYFQLWRATDDRFTMLAGPNEILTLNGTRPWVTSASHMILRDSWFGTEPLLRVAGVSKGRLVTSAGLSHGEWLKIGSPDTAEEAANRLNEKYAGRLYMGPSIRLGDPLNFDANPIYGHPVSEIYNSWISSADEMPFSQVHSLENISIAPNHVLLSEDFGWDEKVEFRRSYRWGSILSTNGGFFIGVGTGVHDILKVLPPGSYVPYAESVKLPEEAENVHHPI